MKKILTTIKGFALCMLLLNIASCSSEFNETNGFSTVSNSQPVINTVTQASSNQNVTTGVVGRTYFIKGKNLTGTFDVKFNGLSANVNPTFVTDNVVIVNVPFGTPFINSSNKLVLSTAVGDAEFDFSILSIDSFTEGIQNGKTTVTINGGDFTNASKVVFASGSEAAGNLEEKEATILDSDAETITVEVPDGIIQAFISVHIGNVSAVALDSYGFNYPIFTDELFGWTIAGWGAPQEIVTDQFSIGTTSVRKDANNWNGLSFFIGDGPDLVFTDYETLSFQIYPANENTVKIGVRLNSEDDSRQVIDVVPGQWNKFDMRLRDFYPTNPPNVIDRIDFQEFSGGTAPFLFYVDQLGLIE